MTDPRLFVVTCILLTAPLSAGARVAIARAHPGERVERSEPSEHPERPERPGAIRTTDRRLHRLVQEGRRSSATFRALVDRLEQSDVVVYLECEGGMREGVAGRLSFVSAVGGHRYVAVRLRRLMPRTQQLALMAHELRHAVEIADAPAVVDDATLALEYMRIGFINRGAMASGLTFDSEAAVQTGRTVLRELAGPAAD